MNIGRVEIASRDRERYIFLWSSPSRCSLVALTWWACSRRIRDVHSAMFIPRWCFQPCGNNPLRCVCGPPRHCIFVIVESDDIQGISVVTLTQWGPPEFGAPDDQCLGQYLRQCCRYGLRSASPRRQCFRGSSRRIEQSHAENIVFYTWNCPSICRAIAVARESHVVV